MKIYTQVGDTGQTSLFSGEKVSKKNLRIETYGTLDELNSFVGLLIAQLERSDELEKIQIELHNIQNQLFNLGSYLATTDATPQHSRLPKLNEMEITQLEKSIDQWQDKLPALNEFILPGGHITAAQCHVCRTICRRTERLVVALAEQETIPNYTIKYLNRLSDYFFVLARWCNHVNHWVEPKWLKG